MDSYNFFDRLKKFLSNKHCRRTLIIFLLFLLFFVIGKCKTYAYDDRLNIRFDSESTEGIGYFYDFSSRGVFYFQLKKGSTYHFVVDSKNAQPSRRYCVTSIDKPATNVYFQTQVYTGSDLPDEFNFYAPYDCWICFGMETYSGQSVTCQKIGTTLDTIASDLSGSFDLWEVFENAIPYVVVVVLCGFGFFIIIYFVRRLQRL